MPVMTFEMQARQHLQRVISNALESCNGTLNTDELASRLLHDLVQPVNGWAMAYLAGVQMAPRMEEFVQNQLPKDHSQAART